MKSPKHHFTIGFVFLCNAATLFIVGLATHVHALWLVGWPMLVFGIVFLATSRRSPASSDSPIT